MRARHVLLFPWLFGSACASGSSDAESSRDGAQPFDGASADGSVLDSEFDATSDAASADAGRDAAPNSEGDAASAQPCATCCADGFERGTGDMKTRLVAPFTPSPEGVTVCPSGDVFVALDGNGEIWRIPRASEVPELFAQVGARQPAGIACDDRGRLFVAIYAVHTDPAPAPSVVMITEKDAAPIVLPAPAETPALAGLNGIVAVAGIGVYASDTPSNRLVLWRESAPNQFEARIVATDVSSANGLAFDPRKRALYVALSLNQRVFSYAVADDGSLSGRADAAAGRDVVGFWDGVAVDETGALYTASFLAGSVVHVADNRAVGSVPSPASLAFRGGTLFATDYKFGAPDQKGGLYAIDLGVCGAVRGKASP